MISAAFHDRRIRAIAIVLVVLKLWLISAQPMVVIAGARHDDRLFVEAANRIVTGRWLGDYDQLTLAKGVGYPLFIAGSVILGLPLPLAEHGFYLFACWMLVRALRPVLRHDAWALLLFAGLAWQPMSFTLPVAVGASGSVVRQNLYTPLTLLILAGLVALHTRRTAGPWVRAGWALLTGGCAGWFWITREESTWIIPSVVLLFAVTAVVLARDDGRWWRKLWPFGMATVTATLPVVGVCAMNAAHYRWFGTCEFHAREFVAAYSALTRVQAAPPLSRVPVTAQARQAIYAASPAFAQLQPLLEDEMRLRWAGGRANTEFNGGMWMWALRDAVVETIHAPDARTALAFYQRLADEVNAACDAGRLPAGPRRNSFLPAWQAGYSADLRRSLLPLARYFVLFEGFSARPVESQSHGTPELLWFFQDLGQWPISPTAEVTGPPLPRTMRMRGWRIALLQEIGDVMRWMIVGALVLAALAWSWSAVRAIRQRAAPDYLWWVATAALGGAGAIYVITLLVHVTSWPDVRPLRFAPGYPLLVLFAGAVIVDAAACIPWRRWWPQKTSPSLSAEKLSAG